MTGIEVRLEFRAYIYDPDRPSRKLGSPTGTYEQALDWRQRALKIIKQEAKQAAAERRAQAALENLEKTLRGRI